jgi:acetate---CoA ligase (ADP-forming)
VEGVREHRQPAHVPAGVRGGCAQPGAAAVIAHKPDVGGVRLGVVGPAELDAASADLSARLGPQVTVTAVADPGVELILGMARDLALGPLIVLGAGEVLAEYQSDRAVALPPLTASAAAELIAGQRFAPLLDGFRGSGSR